MSQSQPAQQHECPIMFKHFQEMQQKRRLQELSYMGQQNHVDQNHVDQLCLFKKQTPGIQVPPLFDGNPFCDSPNMFSIGLPCQSQAVSPMGALPHQLNMFPYGSPVVGLGNNLSPHPTSQGLSNDTSILTDSNIVQVELSGISHETFNNSSMSEHSNVSCCDSDHGFMSGIGLAPKQVFQENFFGQIPNKGIDGKQVSESPCKSSMQESCGGQEHGNVRGLSGVGRTSGSSDCVFSFPTVQSGSLSQSYTMNINSQGLQRLNHKFSGHEEIHSGSQLDTSCFHGQSVTLDTTYQRSKKHLLNQSHVDGDIVEHRTGTLYKSKEFVQSSEKIQTNASEVSLAHPDSSSIARSSIGLRLGSPSQGIPRSHTSLESLSLFYNQLQNQSLPLHVGSHSPQEMFPTQDLETMPFSRLRVLSNVNRQAAHELGSEIPAQQPQFELGFRMFSSNFLQPIASTTSSLEHNPRTSQEQHSQSMFRDRNDLEVIDSSLQKPQGFDSNEAEWAHHEPPSARDHDSFDHSPQVHQNYSPEKFQSLIKTEKGHGKMYGKYKGVRIMERSGANVGEKYNLLSFLEYKAVKARGDQLLGQPNETVSTGIGSNKVKEGKLSLQIAPSGFKHQRNSKNRQILSMPAAKNTSHQLPVDQNFDIRRSKKRKLDSFDSLPWYKEVLQGSLKFPDFSMIELEWCLASNRRSQRVEDEDEVLQDSALIQRPKRRLTKSTQLMQQLFPPSPTVIISADAFSNCDSVVYFVARLALGDACNMACDFHMQTTSGDTKYDKVETPGICGGKELLSSMETFICRVGRLHADIIRQEERASFLDLKVESQNMEKLATINRLARFHNQGNAGAVETSTVTPIVPKPAPQRYVVAFPMPKTVPRGVKCLSL